MSESLSKLELATGLTFVLMFLSGLVTCNIQRVMYFTEGRLVWWPAYVPFSLLGLGVLLLAALLVRGLWRRIRRRR